MESDRVRIFQEITDSIGMDEFNRQLQVGEQAGSGSAWACAPVEEAPRIVLVSA
jgi:hypothetical protein